MELDITTYLDKIDPSLIANLDKTHPGLVHITSLLMFFRFVAKVIAPHLHDAIQAIIQKAVLAGLNPDAIEAILNSLAYKMLAFVLDLLFSVKIPKTIIESSKP
jgi:hypothetical protein